MPTLLLRYLPHLLGAAAAIGLVLWFSHARYQAGYGAAQAQMAEAARKAEAATNAAEAKAKSISEAHDREWQSERNNLQERITGLLARPAPAIRLCKPAASRGEVPAVPATAGQPDGAAAGSGQDLRVGEDIGRAALVLASQCERDRRQLSALQAWVAEQAR